MSKGKAFPTDIDLDLISEFWNDFIDTVADECIFSLKKHDDGDISIIAREEDARQSVYFDVGSIEVIEDIRKLADWLESLR